MRRCPSTTSVTSPAKSGPTKTELELTKTLVASSIIKGLDYLSGKAVLPMILGLGCTTMATMTTRVLESRKERIVTTMLLALAVPCSAQLGVLLALTAALSPTGALVWLGIMAGVILLVAIIAAVALTLRQRTGSHRQNPSMQVRVTKDERVRLVKMDAEPRQGS